MNRLQRNAVTAAFLFVLLGTVYVADRRFCADVQTAVRQAASPSDDVRKYHGKAFAVVEVIDGDTLDIDISDAESLQTRIRLLGVDTPETKHPTVSVMYYGPEAAEFTTRLALGQKATVLLDTVGDQRDRYGRLLAYIRLADGRILNEEIIRYGFGYAYLPYRHSRSEEYEQIMNSAIGQKQGLWKNAARDQLPKWLQQKRPELLRN